MVLTFMLLYLLTCSSTKDRHAVLPSHAGLGASQRAHGKHMHLQGHATTWSGKGACQRSMVGRLCWQ